ncbi:MAG: hypothetical protein L0H74_08950 [Brachybacterium sp.]|nr:hypothetical protein [Brachybacterium sp.]
MSDDETLTLDGMALQANDTDEQMVEALSGLDFIYSPLLGLEGGELGKLNRDIRDGYLTLPGRSRRQSLDLMMGALDRGLDQNEQWRAEERKRWWRQHGAVLAFVTSMAVVLIVVSVFSETILTFLLESGSALPAGTEDWVVAIYEIATGTVLPMMGILALMAVGVVIVRGMTRRSSTM